MASQDPTIQDPGVGRRRQFFRTDLSTSILRCRHDHYGQLVVAAALLAGCQCAMPPDARPVSGCDTFHVVSRSDVGTERRPSCARTRRHGSTVALESLEFSPIFVSRNHHHACSHGRSIDQHCDPRWIGRWPCGSAKYGKPSPPGPGLAGDMTRSPASSEKKKEDKPPWQLNRNNKSATTGGHV